MYQVLGAFRRRCVKDQIKRKCLNTKMPGRGECWCVCIYIYSYIYIYIYLYTGKLYSIHTYRLFMYRNSSTTTLSSRLSAIPPDYQNWWVTFWSLGLHVLFSNQNPSIHGFNALILWEDPNLGSDELASALRRRHAGASMGQGVWQPVDRVGTPKGSL